MEFNTLARTPGDRENVLWFMVALRSLKKAIVNAEWNGYGWLDLADGRRRNKEVQESEHSVMDTLHAFRQSSKELCSTGIPVDTPMTTSNAPVRGIPAPHNCSVVYLLCWLGLTIGEAVRDGFVNITGDDGALNIRGHGMVLYLQKLGG